MAALREVLARFGIQFDDAALKRGDKAVDGVASKLGKLGAMLAGGLIVNKLKDMTFELADQADRLAKQSAALGMSIGELQSWQHAAGLSGVASEDLSASIAKLQKATADAAGGSKGASESFRKLGVSVKNADGSVKSADQIFSETGAAIGAIKNPTERTAMAMTLFGRSGAKLVPLFASGADGIAKMRAEVEELGGGFSPEFAKNAEDMNDSISRLNMAWLSFKVRVGGLVIPLINRFVVVATKATAWISKIAKASHLMEAGFAVAAGAALVLGRTMLMAGLRALVPWLPIIAAIAALVLVTDELITLWQGGDTLIGRAIDNIFGEGSTKKAVDWVKGVIGTSSELLSGSHRAIADFMGGLELMWFDMTTWLGGIWKQTWAGLQLITFDAFSAMEGWVYSLQDSFAGMWNSVVDGATSALGVLSKVLDVIPGAGDLAKKVSEAQRDWGYGKAGTGARAEHDATVERRRGMLIRSGDQDPAQIARQRAQIMDRADAFANTPAVNNSTEINVTVPPGTPAAQARAVANAAEAGVRRGNKATQNALVKVAG